MGLRDLLKMDNPPDASDDELFTFISSFVDAKPTIPLELLGVHVSTSFNKSESGASLAFVDIGQHTALGSTFKVAETDPAASSRLFVGNLTVHSGDDPTSSLEQLLAGIGGGTMDSGHPDFLWSPTRNCTTDDPL
jgi:hypothetical protein